MAIEIVSFPIKHGGSFHSKLLVYWAGYQIQSLSDDKKKATFLMMCPGSSSMKYPRKSVSPEKVPVSTDETYCFHHLVGGFNLSFWKIYEFVSWDDDIPNIWKILKKMF